MKTHFAYQIEYLSIDTSFGGFKSLFGIACLRNLEELDIEYCRKLEDISEMGNLKKLKILRLFDLPNKVNDFTILSDLQYLEKLYLINTEEGGQKSIPTIDFLKKLPNLRECFINYNVLDGDLTPLMRLDEANIIVDRKHYNIKNIDLPHR